MRRHQPRPPRRIHPSSVPVPPGLGSETAARGRADGRDALPCTNKRQAELTREPDELVRQAGDVTDSRWQPVCITSAKPIACPTLPDRMQMAETRACGISADRKHQYAPLKITVGIRGGPLGLGQDGIATSSAAAVLPDDSRSLIYGVDGHVAGPHCPTQLDTTTRGLDPYSGQVRSLPRNNFGKVKSMLSEFLWFHIISRIFSHRYVISKAMLIPDKLWPKLAFALASLTPAGFRPGPATRQ